MIANMHIIPGIFDVHASVHFNHSAAYFLIRLVMLTCAIFLGRAACVRVYALVMTM